MKRRSFVKHCLAGGVALWLPTSFASPAPIGFLRSRPAAAGGVTPVEAPAPTEFWRLENVNGSIASQTLTNNGSVTFTSGKLSNAATLNGSTQSLTRASGTALQPEGGSFSIGCWFNPTDVSQETPTRQCLFSRQSAEEEYELTVEAEGEISFSVFTESGQFVLTTVAAATFSAWNFLAAVYDEGALRLYLNGAAAETTPADGLVVVGTSDFCVGKTPNDENLFSGQIDAAFWYRSLQLSAGNVAYLYNGGTGREYFSGAWH